MTTRKQVNEPAAIYASLPVSANADIRGSLPAIPRAAQRARELAQQTGTDLIVARAGQVVRVSPQKKDRG